MITLTTIRWLAGSGVSVFHQSRPSRPKKARLSGRTLCIVVAVGALWASSAPPQSASSGPRGGAQEEFICHLPGNAERRIGIYRPDGGQRCRVDYTRDGATRSLWSAGHDYKFCVQKALEIVRLLETVNFQCRPETKETTGSAPGR